MKDNGRVSIFSADSSGIWSSVISIWYFTLVPLYYSMTNFNEESYYPIPDQKTPADFMNLTEDSENSKQMETISITASVNTPEERENGF